LASFVFTLLKVLRVEKGKAEHGMVKNCKIVLCVPGTWFNRRFGNIMILNLILPQEYSEFNATGNVLAIFSHIFFFSVSGVLHGNASRALALTAMF